MKNNKVKSFKPMLKECQKAFSELTEKEWKEFEKAAKIKWKPAGSSR